MHFALMLMLVANLLMLFAFGLVVARIKNPWLGSLLAGAAGFVAALCGAGLRGFVVFFLVYIAGLVVGLYLGRKPANKGDGNEQS